MAGVEELLSASHIVSTCVGGGSVWAVVRVYLNFIMRDVEKLDIRVSKLEGG